MIQVNWEQTRDNDSGKLGANNRRLFRLTWSKQQTMIQVNWKQTTDNGLGKLGAKNR